MCQAAHLQLPEVQFARASQEQKRARSHVTSGQVIYEVQHIVVDWTFCYTYP